MLEIRLRLQSKPADEDRFADHLGEFFGASYTVAGGVGTVVGYVEASTNSRDRLDRAIEFVRHVRQLGGMPEACDPDLVDLQEIADRVTKDYETVRLWARGQRRKKFPFPTPLYTMARGRQVWPWPEVDEWLGRAAPDLADEVDHLSRTERRIVDAFIMAHDVHVATLMSNAIALARQPAAESMNAPTSAQVLAMSGGWRVHSEFHLGTAHATTLRVILGDAISTLEERRWPSNIDQREQRA